VTSHSHLFDSALYAYHHLTKHTVQKLMASGHYLDWDNQPDPFRLYQGAPYLELPRNLSVSGLSYFQALAATLAGQGIDTAYPLPEPEPPDLSFVSTLLFYGMAISAWKQIPHTEHRWSLRVNPSSGNLHPTETHLIVHSISGLEPGLYHYSVKGHALEQRGGGSRRSNIWELITSSTDCPPLTICLTSIFWREAWKYRERAYRYCQHDLGHALAAILLSAGTLGWRGQIIGEFPDQQLAQLLGLTSSDERPALLIGLRPGLKIPELSPEPEKRSVDWRTDGSNFSGIPNRLSAEEVPYLSIAEMHRATCLSLQSWQSRRGQNRPASALRPSNVSACGPEISCFGQTTDPDSESQAGVHQIVRKRRSAVDLDGIQRMSKEHLAQILSTSTRGFSADFQRPTAWAPDPVPADLGHHLIHLYLYVHRVDDVTPGIYYFDRTKRTLVPLLYSDQREPAKFVSCFQDIAADGCFAVSMIADLELAVELYGDRGYRYVHFEAGLIGQWLYLSATALGYEATGIGCFIDDMINKHLDLLPGLEVIYNFTVGRAVLDPRLTTLPAYDFPDPTEVDLKQ